MRQNFFNGLARLEKEKDMGRRLTIQREFITRLCTVLGYEYHYRMTDLDESGGIPLIGGEEYC